MIKLNEINECNWLDVLKLSVSEDQKGFLAEPLGILARGYVYRNCNARVFAIVSDGTVVGIAMVRDMDEDPATYELQQFMIDVEYQNNGFGTDALMKIIDLLKDEGKYDCVEVCVNKRAAAALHVYQKLGFIDTGYVDSDVPDCLNLKLCFNDK